MALTVESIDGVAPFELIDCYCNEPTCDCHKVSIVAFASNKIWATFSYGWKSKEFYQKWGLDPQAAQMLATGFLDPIATQSEYADILLDAFLDMIKQPQFVERLKKRYALFKNKMSYKKYNLQ